MKFLGGFLPKPEGLGLILDGVFLATNGFDDPTPFLWSEWNPVSKQSDDFNGILISKLADGTIAKANGPYSGKVGQVLTLDASGPFSTNGSIVLYEWDINNDGVYDLSPNSSTIIYTYNTTYDGVVKLKVTDNPNSKDSDVASIVISSTFLGDFDNDCDVDKSDLSSYILNYSLISDSISAEEFVVNFGYFGCQ